VSLKKLMGMLVIVLMLMLVLTALWKIYRDDQQCVTAATSLHGQWWVELQVCVRARAWRHDCRRKAAARQKQMVRHVQRLIVPALVMPH
jgi:hypothetical protein